MDTGRLEAFSDGVFAIAATLLVLEIGVDTSDDLGAALLDIWPSYLAYVTSFLIIGIIWINHHHCVSLIGRVDRPFLFINTLLLLIVAFIPFPTKLVAEFLQNEANDQRSTRTQPPSFSWPSCTTSGGATRGAQGG